MGRGGRERVREYREAKGGQGWEGEKVRGEVERGDGRETIASPHSGTVHCN